jgi:hypothetical protein
MARIWITYAWNDNKDKDVDFVAQELQAAGAIVKLDRWNIGAGRRLWEQIEGFIAKPEETDAWLLVATNSSLASEACKEEFAYALDRALKTRGGNFPVMALFLTHADPALVPAGIRTRLHVSITDPDWKERVVAAAEGRQHAASHAEVNPYHLKIHDTRGRSKPIAIEVRPRAGVWAPFIAGIPASEKDRVDPFIMIGPRDVPTDGGMLLNTGAAPSPDGQIWLMFAGNQSTPTESYFVWCKELPSKLVFGVNGRQPQFEVTFNSSH